MLSALTLLHRRRPISGRKSVEIFVADFRRTSSKPCFALFGTSSDGIFRASDRQKWQRLGARTRRPARQYKRGPRCQRSSVNRPRGFPPIRAAAEPKSARSFRGLVPHGWWWRAFASDGAGPFDDAIPAAEFLQSVLISSVLSPSSKNSDGSYPFVRRPFALCFQPAFKLIDGQIQ